MTGLTTYSAQEALNWTTGDAAPAAVTTRYVGLFTAMPNDAGTGGAEIAYPGYARIALGPTAATATSPATSNNTSTLTFAVGANVAPPAAPTLTANTTGGSLPSETVYVKITYVSAGGETTPSSEASVAVTGTTGQVVVTSPGATTGATGYNVYASSATGTETKQNSTAIAIGTNYDINSIASGAALPATNTASGGTAVGFGVWDALTAGNLISVGWLGNNAMFAFSATLASPGVFTAPGVTSGSSPALADGASVAFTAKNTGSTLPSGIVEGTMYAVAGLASDSFNVGVNTTTTGGGLVQQVVPLAISAGVTPSFPASDITLSAG